MAKGIEAGRAFLLLDIDEKAFNQKLAGIKRSFKNTGKNIAAIGAGIGAFGAAIVGPLALATKQFVTFGDQLNKMAARTGVGVQALSEFKFAAEQSGASLGAVEKGIRKMQQTINDAERGLSTATDGLNALGLSASDLKGKAPEDQFQIIMQRVSEISDPSQKAAAAMMVLGRSGTALLPMAGDLATLRQEARDLGITMDAETARKAAALADTLNRVKVTLMSASVAIGSALAPMLVKLGNYLAETIQRIALFIKENQQLVMVVATVGAVVLTVGTALVTLGSTIGIVTYGIAGLIVAFTFLAAHPVVAALLLIGFAIAGIVTYMKSLRGETAKTAKDLEKITGMDQAGIIRKQNEKYQNQISSLTVAAGPMGAQNVSQNDREILKVLRNVDEGIKILVNLTRRNTGLVAGNG